MVHTVQIMNSRIFQAKAIPNLCFQITTIFTVILFSACMNMTVLSHWKNRLILGLFVTRKFGFHELWNLLCFTKLPKTSLTPNLEKLQLARKQDWSIFTSSSCTRSFVDFLKKNYVKSDIECALCSRNFWNVKLRLHDIDIFQIYCHSDFTWNQILMSSNAQKCHFCQS